MRHGDELHSITIERMIEGTRPRGWPTKKKKNSQIIKDAGAISYKELKDIVIKDSENGESITCILWLRLIKTNLRINKKQIKKL